MHMLTQASASTVSSLSQSVPTPSFQSALAFTPPHRASEKHTSDTMVDDEDTEPPLWFENMSPSMQYALLKFVAEHPENTPDILATLKARRHCSHRDTHVMRN